MALSAAEKKRKYRLKRDADPERRWEYLGKEKAKYESDKAAGKKKLVHNMTAREHRHTKKKWRVYKRSIKKKQEDLKKLITPPDTPESTPHYPESRQMKQSRRRKGQERSKLQRKIRLLESQLEKQTKRTDMYRKRFERSTQNLVDTPRTQTKKLLRNFSCGSKKTLRKTLDFHFSVMKQMKQNYKDKSNSVKDIVKGKILKKYKFRCQFRDNIGMYAGRRLQRKGCLSSHTSKLVKAFFQRDDVSTLTASKNSTITRNKVKKQKRILCDTLANLYKKYISEGKDKISFTTFWRLKPFWVTFATEKDRDTCLCKTCENTKYLAEALWRAEVIPTSRLDTLVKQAVCSIESKKCMYGQCDTCKHKYIPMQIEDKLASVNWQHWQSVKEKRTLRNGEKKEIVLTVRTEETGTIDQLCDKFHEQMWQCYRRHSFNITNQFRHYKEVRETLKTTECFIHIDFAENYVGKRQKEIQSMHFGASQPQISLHTGYYIVGGMTEPVCFSGVSDSLQHDPAAIWAYLRPILKEIKQSHPLVECLHFYSDGPTTQYRQKQNFYLFSTEIHHLGFRKATWNFHEAGHGKGIPDGVGGSLKRAADRRVRYGFDIMNGKTFIKELLQTDTSVKLYYVDEISIKDVENSFKPKSLKPVPGTMKIHQLITTTPAYIKYRDVSCFCSDDTCPDHKFEEFAFSSSTIISGSKRKTNNVGQSERTNEFAFPSSTKISGRKHKTNNVGQSERTNDPPSKRRKIAVENVRNRPENDSLTYLKTLQRCNTFEELKFECREMEDIEGQRRSILGDMRLVDESAMDIFPDDVPGDQILFPTAVKADGDCLPACGSVFAFGNEDQANAIRARIIIELAVHEDLYLNQEHLQQGIGSIENQNLAKVFATFSQMYVPGICLTNENIKAIYEAEVMEIRKPKTWMGIWQLFALSSVIQMPLFCVYPKLGNPNVRKDLHRLIKPRIEKTSASASIMWSSTRYDMQQEHWVPNHFVPVLPIDISQKCKEKEQTSGGMGKNDELKGQLVDIGEDYNPNRQANGDTGEEKVDIQDNGDTREEENRDRQTNGDTREEEIVDRQANGDTGEEENTDRHTHGDTREEEIVDRQTNGDTGEEDNTDIHANGDTGEEENRDRQENGDYVEEENIDRQANGDTREEENIDRQANGDTIEEEIVDRKENGDTGEEENIDRQANGDTREEENTDRQANGETGEEEDIDRQAKGDTIEEEIVDIQVNGNIREEEIVDRQANGDTREEENTDRQANGDTGEEKNIDRQANGDTIEEEIVDRQANGDTREEEIVDIQANGDTGEEENTDRQANGDTREENIDRYANRDTIEEEIVDRQANGDTREEENRDRQTNGDIREEENTDIHANGDTIEEENRDRHANGDTREENTDRHANGDTREEENRDRHANGDTREEEIVDRQANGDTGEEENRDRQTNGDTREEENKDRQANGDTGEEENIDIHANGDTREEENRDRQTNGDTREENRDRQANGDTGEEETRGEQTNGDTREESTDTHSNGDTREENTVRQSNGDAGENTKEDIGQALIENDLNDDEGHHVLYGLIADMDITSINSFLNQYVVVLYDNDLYPGYVEDVEESDLYCECMHKVGRRENCFSWPMQIKDKCWYELENVLAIIPQPEKIEGSHSHFCVQKTVWEQIKLLLKGKYKQ